MKKAKEEELILVSEALKALAHPTRISMLILINGRDGKEISVNEIQSEIKISQPDASRHLSILKAKHILKSNRDGSFVYYSINKDFPVILNIINCIINFKKR